MSTTTRTPTGTSQSFRSATWAAVVGLVLLTPSIMGSFVAGRLGSGGWMLLFVLLGLGLTRLPDEQPR